jgi:glyoxylase-like metal-dependent hydrolase (beta-lactamase superfamily II)
MAARQTASPDPLVRENTTVTLAAHTHVIPDHDVPLVPNVGVVVGSRAVLVIDPGLGRRNGETVLREVQRIAPSKEIFIASTHYHAEHTTGFLGFPPTARYVASAIQTAEFERGGAQQIKEFARRSAVTAELLKDAVAPKPAISFDREHALDLGGLTVRMLVVGPTHTRGDTTFFVEGDRVLFAGDVVMNKSFLAAREESSIRAWLVAFDVLEALRPAVVVPAHGAVGDGSLIPANRALMQAVQARARELKAKGHAADETAEMVQKEFRAKHPDWPRFNGLLAAAKSAYAEAQ